MNSPSYPGTNTPRTPPSYPGSNTLVTPTIPHVPRNTNTLSNIPTPALIPLVPHFYPKGGVTDRWQRIADEMQRSLPDVINQVVMS